jgi:hypothetical protein
MRFRRKREKRRIALPIMAMVVGVAASWYWAMPGLALGTAEAHAAQPVQYKATVFHGTLRHGGIPLETLRNARTRLDDAEVRNSRGDPVGFVKAVVAGDGGRPERVVVGFGGFLGVGAQFVEFQANWLGYDPAHHVVLTDMTVKQLYVIAARRNGADQTQGG